MHSAVEHCRYLPSPVQIVEWSPGRGCLQFSGVSRGLSQLLSTQRVQVVSPL